MFTSCVFDQVVGLLSSMIKYYIFYEYFRHVFINLNIEISNINGFEKLLDKLKRTPLGIPIMAEGRILHTIC